MDQRLKLQELLEEILPDVYFQPKQNVRLNYPCIVYQRDGAKTQHADNTPYRYSQRYQVTVINRDPDHVSVDKMTQLPHCAYSRHFISDGLHHDIFTLYF